MKARRAADFIAGVLEPLPVPGAAIAACVDGTEHVWTHGVCRSGDAERVGEDTRFQIASCSKAFTATLAGMLVDQGVIGWDDPVRRHIPEFVLDTEDAASQATVRDLLSMRLGFASGGVLTWGRNTECGTDVLIRRLRHAQRIAPPRAAFTYFNPAYILVAEIIARRTGMGFAAALDDMLLAPLGLADSFAREGRLHDTRGHALPHIVSGETPLPLGEARCGGRIGESGLYVSARDAAAWLHFQLGDGTAAGKRVLSATALGELQRPHVVSPAPPGLGVPHIGYGMGWQVRGEGEGMLLVHEGSEFGVTTCIVLSKARRAGVAVFLNARRMAATQGLAQGVLDIITGVSGPDWVEHFSRFEEAGRQARRKALDAVSGTTVGAVTVEGAWFHPAHGAIEIGREAGNLEMRVLDGWIYDASLEPSAEGAFEAHFRYPGTTDLIGFDVPVRVSLDVRSTRLHLAGVGSFVRL